MNKPDSTDDAVKPVQSDMFTINIKYAITINPDDTHQYHDNSTLLNKSSGSVTQRLYYVNRYVNNKIVLRYKELGIQFELYPEIKNCNDDKKQCTIPRIHYHGYVTFINIQGLSLWYMHVYTDIKHMSLVCIKHITDEDKWCEYIFKNKKTMKLLCRYQNVKYGIKSTSVKNI